MPLAAVRDLVRLIGVAKANSSADVGMPESLHPRRVEPHGASRMAVLKPLKVVIENYPEDMSWRSGVAINHPVRSKRRYSGRSPSDARSILSGADFHGNPPKKFFRLSPVNEVRLRYAYFIT